MPGKRHKRFTKKGHRMIKHLEGKVKNPYAVVQSKDHKHGLVIKRRRRKK